MPILCFVSIPPNTLDKILEVFFNLESSLKFKMLLRGGRGVFMYKDENLKALYMEKNNR
jgi:hypothetical protein